MLGFFLFLFCYSSIAQPKLLLESKNSKIDAIRYSLFTILYPVGISSEWWLMFQATKVTDNQPVAALFAFFLGLYVPGK
jgi:hypothetical protein